VWGRKRVKRFEDNAPRGGFQKSPLWTLFYARPKVRFDKQFFGDFGSRHQRTPSAFDCRLFPARARGAGETRQSRPPVGGLRGVGVPAQFRSWHARRARCGSGVRDVEQRAAASNAGITHSDSADESTAVPVKSSRSPRHVH